MGRTRLAAAIAARWRVPEQSIVLRLNKGRVRVKSNLPEARARQVADDLVGMGAIVSVVDSTTGAPLALTAPGASAFSGTAPAFEFEDVDDEEEEETQVSSTPGTMYNPDTPLAQVQTLAPAPIAPAPMAQAPPAVLAPPSLMPPTPSTAMGATPVKTSGAGSAPTQAARRPPPGANLVQAFFFEHPQMRIFAGVSIAIFLGLVTSAVYVSQARESSYQAIIDELVDYQSKELSLSQWQTDLPEVRSETVLQLRSRRNTMMLGSVLIWLGVGGAFSLAWFRYIC